KEHIHYDYLRATGPSAELVYEDHGEDTWLEVCLVAEGQNGEGKECIELFPAAEAVEAATDAASSPADESPDDAAQPAESTDQAAERQGTSPQTDAQVEPAPAGDGRGIRREVWNDVSGDTIADLTGLASYPASPDVVEILPALEVSGPVA